MDKIGLFLGTKRGLVILKELLNGGRHIVCALILDQQEHEIENVTEEIIKLCEENNILYRKSSEVKPKDYYSFFSSFSLDIVFVISWRYLISSDCFDLPSRGMFVLHDSLLPAYRGFAPTNWVIINGEKETGLTLQYIDTDMDAGDIVDQKKIVITENMTANDLNNIFLKLYPKIILENIDNILKNENKRTHQDNSKATFVCKRAPEDGKIDMNRTTSEIVRLVNGLTYPYPGAYCYYKGKKVMIWEAEQVINPPQYVGRIPGRIIRMTAEYVDILTHDGVLRIKKVSLEGSHTVFLTPKEVFVSIYHALQ